ncbi:amidohydrolase [Alphaproteobacteria bacterium]|nr:amidohydrolase [Alphaproteobacteria bacterium]
MIVDFQHHYTPRELFRADPNAGNKTYYDENGVPSYSFHSLLYDLDEHIAMMDVAGIDAAVLSCAEGMCGLPESCRIANDKIYDATQSYPGRFIGTAHAHPLGGPDAFKELARCKNELGFPGVVITSEFNGNLDNPELNPFWAEAQRLGLYVFIHPALKLDHGAQYDAYDLARSVGREFSLVQAMVRLINGGVLDQFPELTVQIAHLGGGIATVLGRIRSYQDKKFWGTKGNERHGGLPDHDFDYYLRERLIFDTAGFCGDVRSVKTSLVELPSERIVFASDYPQEIRAREAVKFFVDGIRALGEDGARILDQNTGLLLPGQ